MIFDTYVNGIPCQVCVDIQHPLFLPDSKTYSFLDSKGNPAPYLEKILTKLDRARIEEEASACFIADKYGYDF